MENLDIIVQRYGADGKFLESGIWGDAALYGLPNPKQADQLIILVYDGLSGGIEFMPICGRLEIFAEVTNG